MKLVYISVLVFAIIGIIYCLRKIAILIKYWDDKKKDIFNNETESEKHGKR